MHARSQLGKGSQFTVKLNLPLGEKSPLSPSVQTNEVGLDGQRILLVEDNEINQIIATEMLIQSGATVECAENGKVALNKMEEQTYDLVLMDIQMPVMDGCATIVNIRQKTQWHNIPVIALTANVMLHDIEKYKELGFTDHIGKPFERERLLNVIHLHLAQPS